MHDYQRVDFLLRLTELCARQGWNYRPVFDELKRELNIPKPPTTRAELQAEVHRAMNAVCAYTEEV